MHITDVTPTTNPVPTANTSPSLAAGKYQAEIMNASYEFIQAQNYDRVTIELCLLGGACPHHVLTKQYHLKSASARKFLQNEFEKLGQAVDKRSDLKPACAGVTGKKVFISVKYSPSGNRTVYITDTVKPVAAVDPDAIWN